MSLLARNLAVGVGRGGIPGFGLKNTWRTSMIGDGGVAGTEFWMSQIVARPGANMEQAMFSSSEFGFRENVLAMEENIW